MRREEIPLEIEKEQRTIEHLERSIKDCQRTIEHLEKLSPSCMNCEHFPKKICNLAGEVPPPEVRATGCPEWSHDMIPF